MITTDEPVAINPWQMDDNVYAQMLVTVKNGSVLYKAPSGDDITLWKFCDIIFEGVHCNTLDEFDRAVQEYKHRED